MHKGRNRVSETKHLFISDVDFLAKTLSHEICFLLYTIKQLYYENENNIHLAQYFLLRVLHICHFSQR